MVNTFIFQVTLTDRDLHSPEYSRSLMHAYLEDALQNADMWYYDAMVTFVGSVPSKQADNE